MRFNDLFDPERALAVLLKLALWPLILMIVCQLVVCLLRQLSAAAELGFLCFLLLLCPLAYLIRERRRGHPRREGARRGAERTPLPPPNEELQ